MATPRTLRPAARRGGPSGQCVQAAQVDEVGRGRLERVGQVAVAQERRELAAVDQQDGAPPRARGRRRRPGRARCGGSRGGWCTTRLLADLEADARSRHGQQPPSTRSTATTMPSRSPRAVEHVEDRDGGAAGRWRRDQAGRLARDGGSWLVLRSVSRHQYYGMVAAGLEWDMCPVVVCARRAHTLRGRTTGGTRHQHRGPEVRRYVRR